MKRLQYLGLAIACCVFFLAAFGIYSTQLNRDLTKVDKTTGEVVLASEVMRDPGGTHSFPQKVFMFQLSNLEKPLGTYRPGQDYTKLIQNIKIGDTITVYYNKKIIDNNLNIEVYQIEKNNQVLQDYKSYAHNHLIAAVLLVLSGFILLIYGILKILLSKYEGKINKPRIT